VTYRPLVPWQVLERKTLVSKHWLTLYEDRVRLANGHEIDEFHVVEGPSWAGVLSVTDDDRVVLVRQYRHGIASETLELPAGVLEPGELPLEAARRELREETGFTPRTLEPIATLATEPSRHTVRAHFFCAKGCRLTESRDPDASEDIEVVLVPRIELGKMVDSGQIVHAVHVAAILLAERRGLLAGP